MRQEDANGLGKPSIEVASNVQSPVLIEHHLPVGFAPQPQFLNRRSSRLEFGILRVHREYQGVVGVAARSANNPRPALRANFVTIRSSPVSLSFIRASSCHTLPHPK